ncbi:MAG: cell envelope integrity protein TolA [Pseudomonadota bacterium]|nr:cell envelope integrity protein TolA [Pseudomonadota bacterium]
MPASADRLQFAPPPPPGMVRAFGFAVIAHLLLMLALTWGINWKRDPVTLSVDAELWSSMPQEAAPKLVEVAPPPPPPLPVPVPTPAPPPPVEIVKPAPLPEPPTAVDIAIERAKEKKAEDRRKQLALEREKKREAQKELAAQKKLAAEKELEARRKLEAQQQAQLAKARQAEDRQKQESARKSRQVEDARRMEAQREDNLKRMQGLAGATGGQESRGSAVRSSGISAAYAGRIAARVKRNIVFGEEVAGNPRAEVEVQTSPDGTIVGQRIVKSSGVRSWDEAVLKAVIKTEILPRDVDGHVPPSFNIGFRPKD